MPGFDEIDKRDVLIRRIEGKDAAALEAEASRLAALSHPGLQRITNIGRDNAGVFVVLEKLHGHSLPCLIEHQRMGDADFGIFCRQSLAVLACAHEAGWFHPCLTPARFFLVPDADTDTHGVKLCDFGMLGIGLKTDDFPAEYYLPPAQCDGARANAAANLYSFAAVAYYALTGRHPPIGTNRRVAVPPEVMTAGIAQWLSSAFSPDPSVRPSGARAMLRGLGAILVQAHVAPDALPVPVPAPNAAPKTAPRFLPKDAPVFAPTAAPASVPAVAPKSVPASMPKVAPVIAPKAAPVFLPKNAPVFVPKAASASGTAPAPALNPSSTTAPAPAAVSTTKRRPLVLLIGLLSGIGAAIIGVGAYCHMHGVASQGNDSQSAPIQPTQPTTRLATPAPAGPMPRTANVKAPPASPGTRALIPGAGANVMINDSNRAVAYAGHWSPARVRRLGDFGDDVHATNVNGDSASLKFHGLGVDFITECYSDEGEVNIYLDGKFVKTVDCGSKDRKVRQAVFHQSWGTEGNHVIKVEKKSGQYMLVDAFKVYHAAK